MTGDAREERRAQLLDAAQQVFAAKGYHETKVSDIVAAAGVAQGTFYLYFDSKRAVFDALIRSCAQTFAAAVAGFRPLAETEEADAQALESLARQIQVLLGMYRQNAALMHLLLIKAPATDTEAYLAVEEMRRALAGVIEQNLRTAMLRGRVRPLDPRIAAESVVGMVERVALRWYLGVAETEPAAETPDPAQAADQLARLVLFGLTGRPRSGPAR